MRSHGVGWSLALAFSGTMVALGFAACSGGSNATNGSDGGGPVGDGSLPPTDGSTSPTDSSASNADGNITDAGDASADSEADALPQGPFIVITTIPLSGVPSAMAFNPETNTLYVAITGNATTPATIAVIDAATNMVATIIPTPGDASAPWAIPLLAVDFVSNTLYAADSNPNGQTLYTISGITNAVTAATPIGSAYGIQVNSLTHTTYILGAGSPIVPDGGTTSVTPATVSVLGGSEGPDASDASTGPLPFNDIAIGPTTQIAVDSVSNRLYLCGPSAASLSSDVVDTLDTNNGLAPIATQSFGQAIGVGCLAGWGGSAVVTQSTGGASGAVSFIDPATVALPATFAPALAAGTGGSTSASVVAFGSDVTSNLLEALAVTSKDGGAITLPATTVVPSLGAGRWEMVTVASASGGIMRAYLSYESEDDAGAFTPTASVLYASVQLQ